MTIINASAASVHNHQKIGIRLACHLLSHDLRNHLHYGCALFIKGLMAYGPETVICKNHSDTRRFESHHNLLHNKISQLSTLRSQSTHKNPQFSHQPDDTFHAHIMHLLPFLSFLTHLALTLIAYSNLIFWKSPIKLIHNAHCYNPVKKRGLSQSSHSNNDWYNLLY